MKLGLLCFSHYLFIKDMTRKWGCYGDSSVKSLRGGATLFTLLPRLLSAKRKGEGVVFFLLRLHLFFSESNADLMQIECSSMVLFLNAERSH